VQDSYQAGDEVFVRATVLEACSDAFQIRIQDFPTMTITAWAPRSEVAKAEDIVLLKPMRRRDLKYLDPAYEGVKAQKTSEINSEVVGAAKSSPQVR
jgi:hypothetical protein